MDKPELYANTNYWQRKYTQEIIKELNKYFNWKDNNGDTLLDVGTGPGDVMIDFILPLLPKNYKKIVGSDLAEEMVKYGAEVYGPRDPRIEFQILDISDENLRISEQYDHVTSFWVFNWVQNQRLGVENMFKHLKPGGDIVLHFAAKSPFCTTFENLSKTTKWGKYLTDIHRFTFPLQHSRDPVDDFVKCLAETGFIQIRGCRIRKLMFTYKNLHEFRESFQTFNVLESNIPPSLLDEFYLEYFEDIRKQPEVISLGEIDDPTMIPIYNIMAYAKKPIPI